MSNFVNQDNLKTILQKIKSWAEGKFLTEHQDISGKVDKVSGKGLSTNDFTTTLKNKLDGIATGAEVNVQANWNQTDTSADDYIKNKPTLFSGNYNDLSNKPTIPTIPSLSKGTTNGSGNAVTDIAVSGHTVTLTKGATFLTQHQDISGKQDKITSSNKLPYSLISGTPTIPTNNNQLTNGAGYQTESQVSNAISNAISGITSFEYEVVTSLPTTGVKGKIYLKSNNQGANNVYEEYIWVNSAFEMIGTTAVDLSNYLQKTEQTVILLKLTYSSNNGYTLRRYGETAALTYAQILDIFSNHVVAIYDLDSDADFNIAAFNYGNSASCIAVFMGPEQSYWYTFNPDGTYSISTKRFVTTTRTINGKALSSNITLTAADVGAIATGGATNDSALTDAQIAAAFQNAGFPT